MKNLLNKRQYLYPVGLVLLASAILMNRFLPEHPFLDFLEGLFLGLSLVLNIGYLIQRRKKQVLIK